VALGEVKTPHLIFNRLLKLACARFGGQRLRLILPPQGENNHRGFPVVYQVPCDDQLALFSLFGFDLMSRDELLVVVGPDGSGIEGSRSQQL
jgi:hypothetical protein